MDWQQMNKTDIDISVNPKLISCFWFCWLATDVPQKDDEARVDAELVFINTDAVNYNKDLFQSVDVFFLSCSLFKLLISLGARKYLHWE